MKKTIGEISQNPMMLPPSYSEELRRFSACMSTLDPSNNRSNFPISGSQCEMMATK